MVAFSTGEAAHWISLGLATMKECVERVISYMALKHTSILSFPTLPLNYAPLIFRTEGTLWNPACQRGKKRRKVIHCEAQFPGVPGGPIDWRRRTKFGCGDEQWCSNKVKTICRATDKHRRIDTGRANTLSLSLFFLERARTWLQI
jgi:hypothetical protein